MEKEYKVYPDKIRTYTTSSIFLGFSLMFFSVVFQDTWLIAKAFAIFFALLFLYSSIRTFRNGHLKTPDFVISHLGVRDNTRETPLQVPWSDILKIEMVPNNAVMQICILCKSTLQDEQSKTIALQDNLANNGNLAFYSVMIDGFKFRQKQFLSIFKEIERQGVKYNPQILVSEYIDPETKRKLSDQREAQRDMFRRQNKELTRQSKINSKLWQ